MNELMREQFEAAVIARMKESGFLEIEIRVECLARQGDDYHDPSISAYWAFWGIAFRFAVAQREDLLAGLKSLVLFTNPKPFNAVALNNAHRAIKDADWLAIAGPSSLSARLECAQGDLRQAMQIIEKQRDLLRRTLDYYAESCFPEDLLAEVKAAIGDAS